MDDQNGRTLPTKDVEATIEWLRSSEFALVEGRGPEGMGFQSLVFERADGVGVRLGTERDQWMADVRLPGWGRWIDLDIIVIAMKRDTWWSRLRRNRPRKLGSRLPKQLPPAVKWRQMVPDAIGWATVTSDAVPRLERLQHERGVQLFGEIEATDT